MSSQTVNVGDLFGSAHDEGMLSDSSLQALSIVDVGAQIQAGLGVNVDQIQSSEVVLVSMLIDDSGSIADAGNTQVVIDGHNLVLDALLGTKQKNSILVHTSYLNRAPLLPCAPIDQAVRMDRSNYYPGGGTPLYDKSLVVLGTVIAKTQEFSDAGVPVRSITLIVTDGADTASRKADALDVASVVRDMLRQENHIVAAMGVDDGSTNFRKVFMEMGIPDNWIRTPKDTASDIRREFQVFSQSAVRASQNVQSFSKTAVGGFGTP